MFINIATENIILHDVDNSYTIPFRNVEQDLTAKCVTSYKKYLPDAIYVLNGPGSFTNLRVGSLVINILLLLSKNNCRVYTIDKLSLYRSAVLNGFLPRYGYIFMGQRKNIRYYDFVSDNYVVYSKLDLQRHIDHISDHDQDGGYFVDLFVGEDFAEYFKGNDLMVDIVYKNGAIILLFLGKEQDLTSLFSPTQKMEPYYAMEPNIG